MLIMMIKMIIAVSQSISKLGPPDFAWKQIQIIDIDDNDDVDYNNDDDDDDNDSDDNDNDDNDINNGDDYSCKSVNFQAKTSKF